MIKTEKDLKKLIKSEEMNLSLAFNNVTIKPSMTGRGGKFIQVDFYQTNRFHVFSHSKNITRFLQ